MAMTSIRKRALVIAVSMSLLSAVAVAEEGDGWMERLRDQLSTEQTTLDQALDKQEALDADTKSALTEREYHRRLRAMHREAVLISELNHAWIQDQLAHWDCRLAEAQQAEVAERRIELVDAQDQLTSLCTGLSHCDGQQQAVCT